ncbi:MAG: membrane dipeptidase [Gemmatimonadota bacterium]|nr:MAG: membrane dipeptidase [Gemmatimonadota bacterium]
MNTDVRAIVERLHSEAPFTDVHVHPSMKAWMFGRNLWRHYCSGKAWNPFSSRSDFKTLTKGGVGTIWAAHYIPERPLFDNCLLAKIAAALLVPDSGRLFKGSLFQRLNEMMDALEREVGRKPDKVEVAKSAADVRRIRGEGKIAIVHAVEGAHVLEGNIDNLDALARRGVAMLTLTHFYPNGLAAHVDGIPKDMFIRKLCDFKFGAGGSPSLSEFGRSVLRKLKAVRMLLDISHCTPEAREAIYKEVGRDRPIIASHVGVKRYRDDPYNLSDEEIRLIADGGGAVGVIFMSYWLDAANPKNGLPAIWNTIEHLHSVTDSWDHILLGTDFDGFTDPPDDLRDASQVGKVTGMLLDRGLPEDAIKKILGGNAQRLLETGWR